MVEYDGPVVIVDIDGTLADTNHRLHHIKPAQGEKKNWPKFFAEAKNDPPMKHVISIVELLKKNGCFVCLLTGRPDSGREDTELWLKKQGITYDLLLMRPAKDNRLDSIVKKQLFDENLLKVKDQIICAFEDRLHVAEMWRSLGLKVLLCNDEWMGNKPSNESVEVVK